jgi:EmrB/QacA subfamily drug resistance transporter
MAGNGYRNRWGILQVVNMGTFISTLDVGIVNVSLPRMAGEFSVTLAQIQWVVTVYLLTMVVLLPYMGKLSDMYDRRKVYSLGFLVFAIGSFCCAISNGFIPLLLARCLQGIGATMIMANSQAMVRQVFPDHERGRALGFNAIVISAGTLSGPAVGGVMLEFADWPWLFWINVPIALTAFLLGLRLFPSTARSGNKSKFDIAGTMLLGFGTCFLMLAAESSGQGFSPTALAEAAIGLLLLLVLLLQQRKIAYGVLDRELFSYRKVWLGNASSFLINLAQTATLIPVTFYLQSEMGYPAWLTGTLLILQPLLMGVVAPFAGWFRDKYGGFFPITVGAMFCAVSMIGLIVMPSVTIVGVCVQLALFGIGNGLFHATNNAEIMSAAPAAKSSLAGSLLAMVRYMGQITGVGLAAVMVGSMGAQGGDGGELGLSMRLLFAVCMLSCLAVSIGGRMLQPREKPNAASAGPSA